MLDGFIEDFEATRHQFRTDVELGLQLANRDRRVRTLRFHDVVWEIAQLIVEDLQWTSTCGGTVANAYSYRSYTTVALVGQVGGGISVWIEEGSGQKNACHTVIRNLSGMSSERAEARMFDALDVSSATLPWWFVERLSCVAAAFPDRAQRLIAALLDEEDPTNPIARADVERSGC